MESRISRGRARTRLLTIDGALAGLLLVPVQGWMTVRCCRGMAVGACAVVLSWTLLGTGQAWASGSVSHFTGLTGLGQSLNEPRDGAVAATLPDGQVLIAGGNPGSGVLSSAAELFNPATDTFTKLASTLTEARLGALTAVLPSGQVLIAGGLNTRGAVSSAELFNPETDTFTKLTNALTERRRFDAVAATLPSGEVLIAGGSDERGETDYPSSAELFNPATDTFTKLTGPEQSPTVRRAGAVAATLPNGQVLIAGGFNEEGSLSNAELFNPGTDTFTKLTGEGHFLSEGRAGAVAATLPSGEVLIAGGNLRGRTGNGSDLSSAELFNPATDTFTELTGAGQSLTEARWFAVAATLPSGQVLIAGGKNGGGFMSSAELFVPAAQAEIAGGSFGKRTVVGHSAVARLTVMSVGTQGLSISGVTLAGANAADFTVAADSCKGAKLAFGEACTISITFTPSGKGRASATLALNDNESEPATLTLSATGIAATHRTPARKVGHGRKRRHQRHHPTKKRRAKERHRPGGRRARSPTV